MRALTVQQPYASAIACGAKPVENRGRHFPWDSAVGERIAIHAGKRWYTGAEDDRRVLELARKVSAARNDGYVIGAELIWFLVPQGHVLGAIVAVATLTDVHYGDNCGPTPERQQVVDAAGLPDPAVSLCSQWAEPDAWHLVLSDVQHLTQPVPACGHQGLWTVPSDVERQLPCT